MTKLPLIDAARLMRMLGSYGFDIWRTKGSHHILKHPDGRITVVPLHQGKVLPRPLLIEILRQAGIKRDDYLAWLAEN